MPQPNKFSISVVFYLHDINYNQNASMEFKQQGYKVGKAHGCFKKANIVNLLID